MKKTETPQQEKADNSLKKPEVNTLWMSVDETIDWTEALIYSAPRDGLTGQKKWQFYRRMAAKVLEGDRDAYVEVLTTLNPLADLTDYVSGLPQAGLNAYSSAGMTF